MNHSLRFTAEKIATRLALIRPHIIKASVPLAPFGFEELPSADALPGTGEDHGELPWHSYWAGQNLHFNLSGRYQVPAEFTSPALHLPLGVAGDIFTHPEALVLIDDTIVASADRYHQIITLAPELADNHEHTLVLRGWTGLTGWPLDPANTDRLKIEVCSVADIDDTLRELITLAELALELYKQLPEGDRTGQGILSALDSAFLTLDTRHPLGDTFRQSVPRALETLRPSLLACGNKQINTLHAIGHAHMDIAYLWPISQIRQKMARTSANVLQLMDRHADFCFSHSQPQLYAYLEEDFPSLFEKIRQRVEAGRWETMGAMWVEADCNIPGGESLVRQLVLGRRYFSNTFETADTPVLWLPDTFGFPWSLPQLMKQAGINALVANKLNWNQYNRLPASTLNWQGLDGSEVLAHFLTTPRPVQHLPFPTNYKSDLSVKEVQGTVSNASYEAHVNQWPIAYGYGDGGGGPNDDLLLKAKAYQHLPATPHLHLSFVRDAVAALSSDQTQLPRWNDEFYLEGHRGTLTSQAWIKRANRQAEQHLHETEALLVVAYPAGCGDAIRTELEALWRRLCLNQFHDIITGSSIAEVFADARKDFEHLQRATEALFKGASIQVCDPTEHDAVSVFNPAAVSSSKVLLLGDERGEQRVEGGSLIAIEALAPYTLATLPACKHRPEHCVSVEETAEGYKLSNALVSLLVDRDGELRQITDHHSSREVLPTASTGNQLWVFEDRPLSWDAWDIDVFHDDRPHRLSPAVSVEMTENGPLRAAVTVVHTYQRSQVIQQIQLSANSRRVDFVTQVNWHEQQTLLKVAFPTDVLSPRASFDIQWGEIERPTHRNTSWDFARFEVAAQQWASLHERNFGIALLNDCKYGYEIKENILWLSLIKSSTNPDPQADQGEHSFTYSLLPHAGDLCAVRAEARRLNQPLRVIPGSTKPHHNQRPIVQCDAPNILIETIKPADDGDGFVIRFYESNRERKAITLTFSLPVIHAHRCDLLENDAEELEVAGACLNLIVKPFEIVSIRCRVKAD